MRRVEHGPLLCLCLTAPTMEGNLSLLEEYGRYADIVELRVDCMAEGERVHAERLPSLTGLPAILTVRRSSDGGLFTSGEAERVGLLLRLASAGFSHIDLEEDLQAPALDAAVAAGGLRVIRSLHDPLGVPADLELRLSRLARTPREIAKAAVSPKGSADLARLVETAVSPSSAGGATTERIILGMGETGFATRVLAARMRSMLCYASAPGMAAAPGHTTPRTLSEMYRFHAITAETAVYGVMGNPVFHSLSPLIHNRGLAALGLDAVYIPFLVDDPAAFLPAAQLLGVEGLSVTIPHKQAVLPLLARRDGLVDRSGACNTMTRRGPGAWAGTNTDIEGFLSPLRDCLGGRMPEGLSVVVLGAGGAARGVMAALSSGGARVLVLNRSVEKARLLAEASGAEWGPLDASGAERARDARLVVNATSVGMGTAGGPEPLPALRLSEGQTAYDLAYGKGETAFLRRAREAGCRTISGERMLLAQACLQFRIFTGREFPREAREELERGALMGGLSEA